MTSHHIWMAWYCCRYVAMMPQICYFRWNKGHWLFRCLFNGWGFSLKSFLWYKCKNSRLWDKTAIFHAQIFVLEFHLTFSLVEFQYQNYIMGYVIHFFSIQLVSIIFIKLRKIAECLKTNTKSQATLIWTIARSFKTKVIDIAYKSIDTNIQKYFVIFFLCTGYIFPQGYRVWHIPLYIGEMNLKRLLFRYWLNDCGSLTQTYIVPMPYMCSSGETC